MKLWFVHHQGSLLVGRISDVTDSGKIQILPQNRCCHRLTFELHDFAGMDGCQPDALWGDATGGGIGTQHNISSDALMAIDAPVCLYQQRDCISILVPQ